MSKKNKKPYSPPSVNAVDVVMEEATLASCKSCCASSAMTGNGTCGGSCKVIGA